ncbi:MAG: DegT/DnrJ/EryC1/StrS family aminotransferase, partial [Gimesia chilikensis]
QGVLSRPVVPQECSHNGHLYYVLVSDPADRARIIKSLRVDGIQAAYHYVPLHSSPAGQKYGRAFGHLKTTDDIASRLVRLPLSASIEPATQAFVVEKLMHCLSAK